MQSLFMSSMGAIQQSTTDDPHALMLSLAEEKQPEAIYEPKSPKRMRSDTGKDKPYTLNQVKRQRTSSKAVWPQVNIMEADIIPFCLPEFDGLLEGCERVVLTKDSKQVLFQLKAMAEGNQHCVWNVLEQTVDGEVIVNDQFIIKTFNRAKVEDRKRMQVFADILKAYSILQGRDDVKVPKLLNIDTCSTEDGYFMWEYIPGRKATLADVKEILKTMLMDLKARYLEDFRPDNVITTEEGALYVVDPSWLGNPFEGGLDSLALEVSTLIEGWVCPYKAQKVSTEEYEAFMAELETMDLPADVRAEWKSIRATLDAKFYA